MSNLNKRHLFFLITGLIVVPIKTYPTIFTKTGGRDSWISLIFATIFIIIFFLSILYICKRKNCYDIIDIYKAAFGNVIGNFLIIMFALNIFLSLVESAAVEASSINVQFLIYTPVWNLLLLSVPVAVYIVKCGYSAVLSSVLIGIIFISTSGVILFFLTWKYKDFIRLLPILEHGFDMNFFITVIKLIGAYGGLYIVLLYLTDIKDTKIISKYSLYALIYVAQMQIISMTGTIATFEITILNSMSYPKLMQTQLIRQFNFLEAGELFVMLQIVAGWLLRTVITLFAIMKVFKKLNIDRPFMLYLVGICLYFSAFFAGRNLFTLFKLLDYLQYINLMNYVIIPIFVFIIFYIRKKNVNIINE
ncbi:endospore germination permease [Candidatus Clostridium radicumherbarum]|uniref:Endospore germination permease n=1 Tax=Candidatus Clostridium radicumherbarum TaxID=3381662 RepID=A0ABW8TUN9_9CLOT